MDDVKAGLGFVIVLGTFLFPYLLSELWRLQRRIEALEKRLKESR
jgi:hypothetical protein